MQLFRHFERWLRHPPAARPPAQELLASLLTLAWFVEARDPYTGGHLWRVSQFARLLAEKSGQAPADVAWISLGGFLHDLGKIAVPDAILHKAGRLTEEEYRHIQTHPEAGARMLAGHPLAAHVRDAVLLHHERPDGRGYPHGLAEGQIPPMALVVGLCDAFDAMTSHRPYRAGMPREQALALLAEGRGRQFDARLVDHFMALEREGRLAAIVGHSDEGIPLHSCPGCGPIVVRRREHGAGDHLYCGNCGGEFVLKPGAGTLLTEATGRQGSATALTPEADTRLITRFIRATTAALPLNDMFPNHEGSPV